ncbi:hypothetical protein C4559_04330 [Candidatus Microgenomates bacterium]|nr:MAG: hypothetical protein C4559_04330 [Candidatus Microgenomates bacterium]
MDKQFILGILLIIILAGFAFWMFFGNYINRKYILNSNKAYNDIDIPISNIPSVSIPQTTISPINFAIDKKMSAFIYPNSKLIDFEENLLTLKSSDSTEAITNWYKNKIKADKMSIETFIKTKTNNNVSNKLVGTNQNKQITVDIKKTASEKESEIIIKIN